MHQKHKKIGGTIIKYKKTTTITSRNRRRTTTVSTTISAYIHTCTHIKITAIAEAEAEQQSNILQQPLKNTTNEERSQK